jgi:hypothetical protein
MKLAFRFGIDTEPWIVDWNGGFAQGRPDVPIYWEHEGLFWEWFMYDQDDTGSADYVLVLHKVSDAAIPRDINGHRMSQDFTSFFKVAVRFSRKSGNCECGAQKTSNPNCHAMWCPCWRKP